MLDQNTVADTMAAQSSFNARSMPILIQPIWSPPMNDFSPRQFALVPEHPLSWHAIMYFLLLLDVICVQSSRFTLPLDDPTLE